MKKKSCDRFVFDLIGLKGDEPLPENYIITGELCGNCGEPFSKHLARCEGTFFKRFMDEE